MNVDMHDNEDFQKFLEDRKDKWIDKDTETNPERLLDMYHAWKSVQVVVVHALDE